MPSVLLTYIKVVESLKVLSCLLDLQINEQKDCPPPTLLFESTNKTKICSKVKQCFSILHDLCLKNFSILFDFELIFILR